MDSQLPRDPMDEFLRQSLGDYRPDPPDDMWDRISAGMGTPPGLPPVKAAPAMGWLSVAATVLVLVVAAAQYYYYNSRIKHLSGELELLQQSREKGQSQPAIAATLPADGEHLPAMPVPRAAGSGLEREKTADGQPVLYTTEVVVQPVPTQMANGSVQQAALVVLPSNASQGEAETGDAGLV